MPWSNDNVGAGWGEDHELFPGVGERTKFNPQTGRWENIIFKEGGNRHFHGWIDPDKDDAGSQMNPNK